MKMALTKVSPSLSVCNLSCRLSSFCRSRLSTHVFQSAVRLLVEQPQHGGPGVAATDEALQAESASLHQLPLRVGDLHQGRQDLDVQDEAGGGGGRDVVVGRHTAQPGAVEGPGEAGYRQQVDCPPSTPSRGGASSVIINSGLLILIGNCGAII